jgi:hypothetical protein
MFLIYFPYIEGAKRVPWEFLKKCKRIHLMKDYNQMIRLLKIKNDNNRTLEKVRSDLTTQSTLQTPSATRAFPNFVDKLTLARSPFDRII